MSETDPLKSASPTDPHREEVVNTAPTPAASVPDACRASGENNVSATYAPGDEDPTALTDWFAGQVILNDYVVERELGAGGMGKVYLLRSRSTGQPFAVKRAFLRNEDSRRNFLAELRTWIDLPEHPHLVACRFFRTVGDEVVIFAEVVEGGSLADWIRDRRLTRLEQILDVAIQFAWGLHAAHELGLVHQDVKPSNALMTGDGLVKVADFGLARARAVTVQGAGKAPLRPDVTGYFGTPAYKSPEQAAGERLTPATDVWSWGVAVLEMFSGEVTWGTGAAAPEAMKAYLKRSADLELPAMPNGVAEVLQKCFRRDPTERWGSLAAAADALQLAYRQAVVKEYPRPTSASPDTKRQAVVNHHDRRTIGVAEWGDPREWLIKAFEAGGRDPAEVKAFLPPRAGSLKAQAIADLQAYDEAGRIFERLLAEGRDYLPQFAYLCTDKALVHWNIDDMPGAVALYERAVAIFDRLIAEGRQEFANQLAGSCLNAGGAVFSLGDHGAAVTLCGRAVAIYERLVKQEGRRELANFLASAYVNKAAAERGMQDHRAAVALYDQAIAIRERLVVQEGQQEYASELAIAYNGKAAAVSDLGDRYAAVALYDRARAIYERLVEQEGRREFAHDLARTYQGKANALNDLRDYDAAVALYSRAILIFQRLVESEGRREVANELAGACMSNANALNALGNKHAAVAMHDRALVIRERLVVQEGRRELAHELAVAYTNKAVTMRSIGDHRAAVALYDQALAIYERLVELEERRELANHLAVTYTNKAIALSILGDKDAAMTLHDRAIAIYERLVEQEGRRELANFLAAVYMNKAANVRDLGNFRAAVVLYDRAIAIRERLVEQEGRRELRGDLAWTVILRAKTLLGMGDLQGARADVRRALPILKAEIARTGRSDLQGILDWATKTLQEVL